MSETRKRIPSSLYREILCYARSTPGISFSDAARKFGVRPSLFGHWRSYNGLSQRTREEKDTELVEYVRKHAKDALSSIARATGTTQATICRIRNTYGLARQCSYEDCREPACKGHHLCEKHIRELPDGRRKRYLSERVLNFEKRCSQVLSIKEASPSRSWKAIAEEEGMAISSFYRWCRRNGKDLKAYRPIPIGARVKDYLREHPDTDAKTVVSMFGISKNFAETIRRQMGLSRRCTVPECTRIALPHRRCCEEHSDERSRIRAKRQRMLSQLTGASPASSNSGQEQLFLKLAQLFESAKADICDAVVKRLQPAVLETPINWIYD
jgi:transposase-like protein